MNDWLMCDITSLLIFITLIVSNLTKNRVKVRTNSLYLSLLIVSCTTITFRIIYQLIQRHCVYSASSVFALKLFIYLYLISRCYIYAVGLLFIFSSTGILPVFYRNDTYKIIMLLIFNVPVLYILMDCIKHILFTVDKSMNITIQAPIIIVNVSIVLMLFFGFIMILM